MARFAWVVVALAGLVALPSAAGNLLTNPNFDSSLSGWTVFASTDFTVTQTPSTGHLALGAASVTVNAASAQNELTFAQCVAVTPGAGYDIAAWYLYPSTVAQVPTGQVQVQWFDDGACSSPTPAAALVFSSSSVTTPDVWQSLTGTNVIAPGTSQSAKFTPELMTPTAGTSQQYWDELQFGPTGTLPVTLQRFVVE